MRAAQGLRKNMVMPSHSSVGSLKKRLAANMQRGSPGRILTKEKSSANKYSKSAYGNVNPMHISSNGGEEFAMQENARSSNYQSCLQPLPLTSEQQRATSMEKKNKDTYLNMMKNRGSDREQFKT